MIWRLWLLFKLHVVPQLATVVSLDIDLLYHNQFYALLFVSNMGHDHERHKD
jgi:hypothetical protein